MRRTRVGLVGLGFIGKVHAAGLHRLGVDLHVHDDRTELQREAVDTHGATAHDDYASLLDAVDVVDICTPTDTHAALAIAAAAAGKPVISEKPLARTVDEVAQLLDVFRSAGLPLHVAQVVRFFPEYAAAHDAVAAGRIGRPAVLRLTREGGLPGWGRWLHDPVRSGGLILDVMIHDIDFARYIAGDVVRVYATQTRPVGETGVKTHAYAILTHESGAVSHVTASWARKDGFRTSFEFAGDAGILEYATDERAPLRFDPAGIATGKNGLPPITLDEDPYTTELREFLKALDGGPPPRVTAEDGASAVAIALAAMESAETGRAVQPRRFGKPYAGAAPASAASTTTEEVPA